MPPSRSQASRPIAYISGPLQAAVDLARARAFYEHLAHICHESGCEPYVPHQQTDPVHHAGASAHSVYTRDLEAVANADLIVAYVGAPSSGVGAELGIAHERHIPVIGLCGPEGVASRFIEGLLGATPSAVLLRYRDYDECRLVLASAVDAFVDHRWPPRVTGLFQGVGVN
jgi:2'-deoxynucleoside 5'-phosphate N-hydrolase